MLLYLVNANNVQGRAEPELRPRADGAVHPRRRQLHRGRRRRRGPGVDGPQLRQRRPARYVFRPDQARHQQQDVLRHDEELGRPGHHRRDPARQRGEAADRGAVHRQEAVGVLRPPGAGRRTSSTSSPTCSSPTTSRSRRCCARCSGPSSTRPTAKQGLVRTPTEYAVAADVPRRADRRRRSASSWRAETMGQILLNPPNVAGWKANELLAEHERAVSGRAELRQERRRTRCARTAASTTIYDDGDRRRGRPRRAATSASPRCPPSPRNALDRRAPGGDEHRPRATSGGRRRTC